jgi:hypothetical protein
MNDIDILNNFLNSVIRKLNDKTIDENLLNELKLFFINTQLKSNLNDNELIDCMFYGFYIKNLIKNNKNNI